MTNKKFRKTEQAIFIAYYKLHDYPAAKQVAKCAKVSRSTFYRHHASTTNILYDYETYLIKIYSKKMKKYLTQRRVTLKTAFLRLLVFVSTNKEVFTILLKDNHKEIIKYMLAPLKQMIIKEWRLTGDLEKIYNIYENEILGIIELWGTKHDFSIKYLEPILDDIMFLTKTARHSLLPLQ